MPKGASALGDGARYLKTSSRFKASSMCPMQAGPTWDSLEIPEASLGHQGCGGESQVDNEFPEESKKTYSVTATMI